MQFLIAVPLTLHGDELCKGSNRGSYHEDHKGRFTGPTPSFTMVAFWLRVQSSTCDLIF